MDLFPSARQLPIKPWMPQRNPFDPVLRPRLMRDHEVREAARKRLVAKSTDAARRGWQSTRDAQANNPVAAAVLNLHQPEPGDDGAACAECEVSDGYESAMQAPWPCRTYAAVRSEVAPSAARRI